MYAFIKRILDVLVASVVFVVALPLFLVACGAIWISMGLPVFFTQERAGYRGRVFLVLKLRTMREAKKNGVALSDAERLTPVGRWLRAWSLDELPQLWNVFTGEMSLVGPRPLFAEYLPLYSKEQARRHEVKPGITGWAQVNGRNAITWEERFALDVWYVDHCSFWLDMRIMVLTILRVIGGRGVNQSGRATMDKFTGSPLG